MRVTADLCDQQGIVFIPMAAESLGGWHKVALEQLRKLGSALARHTGQEEGETISHLPTRASVLLQKGPPRSSSTGFPAILHLLSEEPSDDQDQVQSDEKDDPQKNIAIKTRSKMIQCFNPPI